MWSNLVSHPRRGRQLLGLFILVLGVGALSLPSLGLMATRGVSIIDLESMRTSAKAMEVLAYLGPDGVDDARMSVYLDFPMLVLYAAALSAACIVIAARAADRGRERMAAAGKTIAWLAPAAAACDALENIAILVVLGDHTGQPWPVILFTFVCVKFTLLAVVIVYLVIGLVRTFGPRAAETTPAD